MNVRLILLALTCGASAASAIEISIPKAVYRPGETVTAKISAPGKVVVENDIRQQSMPVVVGGTKSVDLGSIRKPGLYTVRVIDGTNAAVAVLLAYPQNDALGVRVTTKVTQSPPKLSANVVERFSKALKKKRLKAAASKAIRGWLPKNVSSLGATTVTCTVCIVPGGQFACPACVSSAGGNVVDLSLEVLIELVTIMERDRALSASEANAIRTVVKYGNGAFSILSAGDKLERALGAVQFGVEATIDSELANIVVSNGSSQISKAHLLIKITKKR